MSMGDDSVTFLEDVEYKVVIKKGTKGTLSYIDGSRVLCIPDKDYSGPILLNNDKVRLEWSVLEDFSSKLRVEDSRGHHWISRGKGTCPFICTYCGALSGTNNAGIKCTGSKEDEFGLVTQYSNDIIILDNNKIAVRIMGHLNPSLCDNGFLLPLNGRRFRLGDDLYEIRITEDVVGYPKRMAQMATAIKVN